MLPGYGESIGTEDFLAEVSLSSSSIKSQSSSLERATGTYQTFSNSKEFEARPATHKHQDDVTDAPCLQ